MDNELRKQAVKYLDEYIEFIEDVESIKGERYQKYLARVRDVRNDLDSLDSIRSLDDEMYAYMVITSASHAINIYINKSEGMKKREMQETFSWLRMTTSIMELTTKWPDISAHMTRTDHLSSRAERQNKPRRP